MKEIENVLSEAAKAARAAYKRDWARRHPEKNKIYVAKYWEKRARICTEQCGRDDNGRTNEDA